MANTGYIPILSKDEDAALMQAIRTAYCSLPESERARVNASVAAAGAIKRMGPDGAMELVGKLGVFLARHQVRDGR